MDAERDKYTSSGNIYTGSGPSVGVKKDQILEVECLDRDCHRFGFISHIENDCLILLFVCFPFFSER